MSIRIQTQSILGGWREVASCANDPRMIRQRMDNAARTSGGRIRAIDQNNNIIDIL